MIDWALVEKKPRKKHKVLGANLHELRHQLVSQRDEIAGLGGTAGTRDPPALFSQVDWERVRESPRKEYAVPGQSLLEARSLYSKEKAELGGLRRARFHDGIKDFLSICKETTFADIAREFNVPRAHVEAHLKKLLYAKEIKGKRVPGGLIMDAAPARPAPSQVFHVRVEPGTKLTALVCPNCKAHLDRMPPCKCVHCGVLVESGK